MLTYSGFDLAGCTVSEKLDGICGVWDGAALKTREGNVIHAPDWFVASLPPIPLIGELWCGRGLFEQTLSICTSANSGERWRAVRYMIYRGGEGLAFWHHAQHVVRYSIQTETLAEELARIVKRGGEGLVIRDRDGADWKHKPFSDDDAVVIGHLTGKGALGCLCGSVRVRDRAGREFKLTMRRDSDRSRPPAIGAVVTFEFQGRTRNGVPRFANFRGLRAEQTLDF